MILQPGQAYTEIIQDEVHLSMATMESRGCLGLKSDNYSHVMLKTSSAEYLLCTLVGGVTYQQSLDLKLMPNDNVTFSVQGTNVVYLTGYSYMPAEISADGGNQADDWIEEPSLNVSIPHGSDEMPGVDSQGPDEISEMEPSYFPTVDREDPLQEREGDESFSVEYTEDQSDYQQDANTEVETSLNTRNMKGPSTTTSDLDQTTQSAPDNNTVADVELLAVKEEIHTIVDTTEEDAPSQAEREAAATQPVNLPSTSTGPIHRETHGNLPKLRSRPHPKYKRNRSTFGTNNIRQYHYRQQAIGAEARFTHGHIRHQIPAPVPQMDRSHGDSSRSGEQRHLKCKFCDATFAFPSKLKIHETKHTGEKKYQCEICGKKFAQLSNKMTHFSIHTGARPYKCEYCTKTFRLQSALTVHNRIHTGERPFVCSTCGGAFKQHGHLREHKKTHLKS